MKRRSGTITAPEILGWYGMIAILLAYFLVSFGHISAAGITYQLLNLSGGAGLVIDGLSKKDNPVVALNGIFCLIAVVALVHIVTQ